MAQAPRQPRGLLSLPFEILHQIVDELMHLAMWEPVVPFKTRLIFPVPNEAERLWRGSESVRLLSTTCRRLWEVATPCLYQEVPLFRTCNPPIPADEMPIDPDHYTTWDRALMGDRLFLFLRTMIESRRIRGMVKNLSLSIYLRDPPPNYCLYHRTDPIFAPLLDAGSAAISWHHHFHAVRFPPADEDAGPLLRRLGLAQFARTDFIEKFELPLIPQRMFAAILCLATELQTLVIKCPPIPNTQPPDLPPSYARYNVLSSLLSSCLRDPALGDKILPNLELVTLEFEDTVELRGVDRIWCGFESNAPNASQSLGIMADACPALLLAPRVVEFQVRGAVGGWEEIRPRLKRIACADIETSKPIRALTTICAADALEKLSIFSSLPYREEDMLHTSAVMGNQGSNEAEDDIGDGGNDVMDIDDGDDNDDEWEDEYESGEDEMADNHEADGEDGGFGVDEGGGEDGMEVDDEVLEELPEDPDICKKAISKHAQSLQYLEIGEDIGDVTPLRLRNFDNLRGLRIVITLLATLDHLPSLAFDRILPERLEALHITEWFDAADDVEEEQPTNGAMVQPGHQRDEPARYKGFLSTALRRFAGVCRDTHPSLRRIVLEGETLPGCHHLHRPGLKHLLSDGIELQELFEEAGVQLRSWRDLDAYSREEARVFWWAEDFYDYY